MAKIEIKMLEVDLTHETHRVVDVTEDVKRYFGGRGLANRLIWDNVPQGADPLGPDNILHVGVGPITGLVGTKTVLSFKSPLTGWVGRSAVSGYFGDELVKAQYNAGILIKGKAKRPVYLYVRDDQVEIRGASDLWGKWKLETEAALRDRLGEQNGEIFGVLCIGPAGENRVRFANVSTEFAHSASKWGSGAVMGSKNIKAIAVKGTKGAAYADHSSIWETFKIYAASPKAALQKITTGRFGLAMGPPALLRFAGEGIKNNHLSYDKIVEKSNHLEHYLKYHAWTDGCPGCANPCFAPFFRNDGDRAFGGEMRHDDLGGFNANIMCGYEDMTESNALVDDLGMDSEELGGIVAWAIDLYEQGIISKADLGGIDLKWGDISSVCELMKKIAYKEGRAPAALAEGFRRAYEVFGERSKWYAYEIHGVACPTYDVRNKDIGMALSFGTSHTGARCGSGIHALLLESVTACNFVMRVASQVFGSEEEVVRRYMNAACGWNLSIDDIKEITLRNYYFNRAISLREGYHPVTDDYLPIRAYEEPISDKYGKTWVWDRAEFEAAKKNFYKDKMKLTEQGLPPREGLKRLGLDFIIPVLEPMGKIG